MSKYIRGDDRDELLADVAEMYYEQNLTQAEISRSIKVTRSAISRMLTEARQKGIVFIKVQRPLRLDDEMEHTLMQRFGLKCVRVLKWNQTQRYDELRSRLGTAAAQLLRDLVRPDMIIGVAWGTTVDATIEALDPIDPLPVKVVQLVGVLSSNIHAFNAQALVENLARKLGGQAVYLYTPFIVENEVTARSLLNAPSVHESLEIGKRTDLALLGIGTTVEEYCSLYQGGHISSETLHTLQSAGAVGDVAAYHFDENGRTPDIDLHNLLVGIARDDLLRIPTRLAVAGGEAKAKSILGALRGKYINMLVTDSRTAQRVLELDR